jgi:hypothetical protein
MNIDPKNNENRPNMELGNTIAIFRNTIEEIEEIEEVE